MINVAEVVVIVAICAAVDVIAHFVRGFIPAFRKPQPVVSPQTPEAPASGLQPIYPLSFEVRYAQQDQYGRPAATQSLHPNATRISGRDARVLFEHAKHIYHPDHGRIEILQNGVVRDFFGDV